jgi:hypothetical protein
MDDFRLQKKLQNPKFEGYKLDANDQDDYIERHPLPEGHAVSQFIPGFASSSKSNGNGSSTMLGPLSYKEVKSRIFHNHLTMCPAPDDSPSTNAVYVDAEGNLVAVDLVC